MSANDDSVLRNLNNQLARSLNYLVSNRLINNNDQKKIQMSLENTIAMINEAQNNLGNSENSNYSMYNYYQSTENTPQYYTNYPDYNYLPGVTTKQLQPITLAQIEQGDTIANEIITAPKDFLIMNDNNYNVAYDRWGNQIVTDNSSNYSSKPKQILTKSFTPFAIGKFR